MWISVGKDSSIIEKLKDYVGDKIPLREKIMDRQGTVCCAWEKTAFEEGLKVEIQLMMEAYSLWRK